MFQFPLSDKTLQESYLRKGITGLTFNTAAMRSRKIRERMNEEKLVPVFIMIDNRIGSPVTFMEKLPALIRFEKPSGGRNHIRYFCGELSLPNVTMPHDIIGIFNDREASGDLYI